MQANGDILIRTFRLVTATTLTTTLAYSQRALWLPLLMLTNKQVVAPALDVDEQTGRSD
jgi:hypothetical protein